MLGLLKVSHLKWIPFPIVAASPPRPRAALFPARLSGQIGPGWSCPSPACGFIGSRELHRDLPKVLDNLEDPSARYVLTIHSKPKAVILVRMPFWICFVDIRRPTVYLRFN